MTLDGPLGLDHAAAANAARRLDIDLTNVAVPVDDDTLSVAALANDRVAYVTDRNGNFDDRTSVIIFDINTVAAREARRIGTLSMLTLATGVYAACPAGSVVERVDLGDDGAVTVKTLTAGARAGTAVIALDNRVGLVVNGILRIGAAPDDEYLTIAALPNPSPGNAAPNAGNVVLVRMRSTAIIRRELELGWKRIRRQPGQPRHCVIDRCRYWRRFAAGDRRNRLRPGRIRQADARWWRPTAIPSAGRPMP